MPRRYLLSIDGGGCTWHHPSNRSGEAREHDRASRARDTFSFVAGTSTGSIIVAAIAAGVPAARIVHLYLTRASKVFAGPPLLNTVQRMLFGHMYSTQKLHDLIAEEFGLSSSRMEPERLAGGPAHHRQRGP
jgi:patatin-like phospholipase/acyl hydrolase